MLGLQLFKVSHRGDTNTTDSVQFSSEVIHVFVGDAVFADEAESVLTLRVVPLVVSVRPNVHTVLIAYNTTLGLQFIIIVIIIYLLKSTEQQDAHVINTRTRAGQERHRKLALTFCPLKNKKNKHTRYKNNYDYAYRKNAEKSTRLSDRLNLDNDEKSTA